MKIGAWRKHIMTPEEKAVSDAAAKVMLATKELERTIEAGKFQFSTYYSRTKNCSAGRGYA